MSLSSDHILASWSSDWTWVVLTSSAFLLWQSDVGPFVWPTIPFHGCNWSILLLLPSSNQSLLFLVASMVAMLLMVRDFFFFLAVVALGILAFWWHWPATQLGNVHSYPWQWQPLWCHVMAEYLIFLLEWHVKSLFNDMICFALTHSLMVQFQQNWPPSKPIMLARAKFW